MEKSKLVKGLNIFSFSLMLVLLFIGFFLLSQAYRSDSSKISKSLESKDYRREFVAIKLVQVFDSINSVDAFGKPLEIGHWYFVSKITGVAFPVIWRLSNFSTPHFEIAASNIFPNIEYEKEQRSIRINGKNFDSLPVDVEVLVLRDGEVVLLSQMDPDGKIVVTIQ